MLILLGSASAQDREADPRRRFVEAAARARAHHATDHIEFQGREFRGPGSGSVLHIAISKTPVGGWRAVLEWPTPETRTVQHCEFDGDLRWLSSETRSEYGTRVEVFRYEVHGSDHGELWGAPIVQGRAPMTESLPLPTDGVVTYGDAPFVVLGHGLVSRRDSLLACYGWNGVARPMPMSIEGSGLWRVGGAPFRCLTLVTPYFWSRLVRVVYDAESRDLLGIWDARDGSPYLVAESLVSTPALEYAGGSRVAGTTPGPIGSPALSGAQWESAARDGIPAWFDNWLGMRFVLVPRAEWADGDQARADAAAPLYFQDAEVTNAQFHRFAPVHHSGFARFEPLCDADQPAVLVEHADMVAFADWLTRHDAQYRYRVPTTTEWYHAAGEGRGALLWWDDQVGEASPSGTERVRGALGRANLRDAAFIRDVREAGHAFGWDDGFPASCPVRSLMPNRWGMFGTVGNASEYCLDAEGNEWLVEVGGSWRTGPKEFPRPGLRWYYTRCARDESGFRLVAERRAEVCEAR